MGPETAAPIFVRYGSLPMSHCKRIMTKSVVGKHYLEINLIFKKILNK